LGIIDPEKQIDVLVRHLAAARLGRNFEQIYRVIFGSQIAGLKALASASGGSTSREESASFFDGVKAKFPEFYEKNTFDEWIQYPKTAGLVTQTGDQISITELGREFLIYLGAVQLSENKPF
jgi:hypothetical protein